MSDEDALGSGDAGVPSSTSRWGQLVLEPALEGITVDERFAWLTSRGGVPIAPPVETDWGHYTGFFADPEGNMHSLFAAH